MLSIRLIAIAAVASLGWVGALPWAYPQGPSINLGTAPVPTPTGTFPRGIVPSDVVPSDVMPSGVMPSGVMPSGVVATGVSRCSGVPMPMVERSETWHPSQPLPARV